eukprot:gene7891-9710_t
MAETVDPGLPTQAIWDIPFENLEFKERIGKGSFGSVFKGSYLGLDVAIKKIEKADDPEYLKYIDREVSMLQSLRHPFIVQFSGICVHSTGLYIVTEFVSGGDVRQLLKQTPPIGWSKRISIALDLAKAMVFLHAKKIIHRDLKSKNILLDEYQRIRLCDFGFARMSEQTKKSRHMTMCGTEGWVAPEILLGMSYDTSCDVFSYGVVLAELITGKKPGVDLWVRSPETCFDINPDELKQKSIDGCPQKIIEICAECCMYEPLARPKFEEILAQLKPLHAELIAAAAAAASTVATANTSASTTPNISSPELKSPDLVVTTNGIQQISINNPTLSPPQTPPPQQNLLNSPTIAQSRRNTMSLHRKSTEFQSPVFTDNSNTANNNSTSPTTPRPYSKTTTIADGSQINGSAWRVGSLKPPGYYTLKRRNNTAIQTQALSNHIIKMIERATSDYYYDTSYIQDLLLTFRCFSSPQQIFELLVNRYISNGPENFTNDITGWKKVQKVIQLRVIIFLKRWIDYYTTDFLEEGMVEKLSEFDKICTQNNQSMQSLTSTLVPSNEMEPKLVAELTKKRLEIENKINNINNSVIFNQNNNNQQQQQQSTSSSTNNSPTNNNSNEQILLTSSNNQIQYPVSIIPPPPPANQEYLEICDIHPHELSRQITIVNGSIFQLIQPREYLEYCWEKFSNTPSPWVGGVLTNRPAPNIHKFLDKYQDMVRFFSTEIVKQSNLAKRVATVERFIEAAEKCLLHFDYSGVFCIMESLSDSSIERLTETFKSLSPRVSTIFDNLKSFVSKEGDYKKYRETLQDSQPPCVPQVSLLLDELSFIETSSPKLLPGGIVNFFHYRQLSRKILQSQQLLTPTPHHFRPIPSIQKVLTKPPQELFDNEVIKHYSLICEPPVSL